LVRKGCNVRCNYLGLMLFAAILLGGCFNHESCCDHHGLPTAPSLLKQDSTIKPAVVVGGGVAGLTAANYFLQANIPCIVLEGPKPGGALAQSDSVRNWPGVLDAPGADIMRALKEQVVKNGGVVIDATLTSIDTKQWPFILTVRNNLDGRVQTIKTLTSVIAMGTEPNYLGVPGETGKDGYWGRGVTNCAICDGALFKDKIVAVVGGGDSAIVEAMYLAGIAKKVYVLVRRDVLRANDTRKVNTLKEMRNVSFMYDTAVTAVQGNGKTVTHLEILNNKTKATEKLVVDGMFLAIGSTSNTKILQNECELDVAGYIRLTNGQETTIHGLFAAGDVCDPHLKQAVTASAAGCAAALQAKAFLEERGYLPTSTVISADVEVVSDAKKILPKDKDKEIHVQQGEWITKITSLNHAQQLLESTAGKLMVVDVYGDFCMPCKKMMPIVEELAQFYDYQVCFTKIDVADRSFDIDAFARLVKTEQIMQVPTFLFIKNGNVVKRSLGMMSKETFSKLIEQYKQYDLLPKIQ